VCARREYKLKSACYSREVGILSLTLPLLVIPAQAGIQFLLCFGSSFRRKPESSVFALDLLEGASLRFSARIRASGSLFFACTKKSNQKKCTPGAAPSALRAAGAQGQAGVRSMGILPIRELARIPARDPAGRFRPDLAAADGAQYPEQQQEQKLLCFCLSLFASARRTRALCSSRGPMALRRQRTKRPAGCARGIARIPLLHRMCNQRNPADDADPTRTMRVGRKALGRVSLVPFFARAKKGTRSPEGRVEAFALKNKTNKSKDAGFRLPPE